MKRILLMLLALLICNFSYAGSPDEELSLKSLMSACPASLQSCEIPLDGQFSQLKGLKFHNDQDLDFVYRHHFSTSFKCEICEIGEVPPQLSITIDRKSNKLHLKLLWPERLKKMKHKREDSRTRKAFSDMRDSVRQKAAQIYVSGTPVNRSPAIIQASFNKGMLPLTRAAALDAR